MVVLSIDELTHLLIAAALLCPGVTLASVWTVSSYFLIPAKGQIQSCTPSLSLAAQPRRPDDPFLQFPKAADEQHQVSLSKTNSRSSNKSSIHGSVQWHAAWDRAADSNREHGVVSQPHHPQLRLLLISDDKPIKEQPIRTQQANRTSWHFALTLQSFQVIYITWHENITQLLKHTVCHFYNLAH